MSLTSRITVDELVALNDEMAALARAGLPLDQGLRSISRDIPGRMGRLAQALSERLEQGQSLSAALAEFHDAFPPVYCAVVAAGLRSGRLAVALEGISTTMRRVAELRRLFLAAMAYPFVVLAVASLLFLLFVASTVPSVSAAYRDFDLPHPGWYDRALMATDLVHLLLPWFWLGLLVLMAIWLYRSSRAVAGATAGLRGFPTIAHVLRLGRVATFAEVMSLMVEHQVPLDEAIELSTAASGDATLQQSGKLLADGIRRGETASQAPAGFPPLLGWLMLTGARPDQLAKSLRQTAEAYRRRASYWGNWLGIYLPIFLSAGIGGCIVLLYVLLVLAPFYNLLYLLSLP